MSKRTENAPLLKRTTAKKTGIARNIMERGRKYIHGILWLAVDLISIIAIAINISEATIPAAAANSVVRSGDTRKISPYRARLRIAVIIMLFFIMLL
jgi:hypothetical protein